MALAARPPSWKSTAALTVLTWALVGLALAVGFMQFHLLSVRNETFQQAIASGLGALTGLRGSSLTEGLLLWVFAAHVLASAFAANANVVPKRSFETDAIDRRWGPCAQLSLWTGVATSTLMALFVVSPENGWIPVALWLVFGWILNGGALFVLACVPCLAVAFVIHVADRCDARLGDPEAG